MNSLIADNIDLWTAAIKRKSSAGRGGGKKTELYGIKKLRELILELAVRGLLVPQDANDEPAEVLLDRIATEKVRLLAEGKIKKQKALPPVGDEEKPFELPVGWAFCRLQKMVTLLGDGLHGTPNYDDCGEYYFVNGNNLSDGLIKIKPETKRVNQAEYKKHKKELNSRTVLVSINGTLGNIAFYNNEPVMLGKSACYFNLVAGLPKTFIKKLIESPYFLSYAVNNATGSTIKNLGLKAMNYLPVALPPLEEQYRIVTKVNELMILCDQLEQETEANISTHQTLVETLLSAITSTNSAEAIPLLFTNFDNLFTTEDSIDQLKQTILQLAVMGKLVPQDPNDEPASVLLEKIAAEKAQLIKEKKIKKQKALPPIGEDEKPFELPVGWEWCRIVDASLITEYGISAKTFDMDEGIPVLKMGDIQEGKVILGGQKKTSSDYEGIDQLMLENGDLLYNRTNSAELVGKTGVFFGPDNTYSFASYLIRIKCSKALMSPEFLNISMNTPLFRATQIEPHLKQQCGQANVNGTIMKSMIVPVAPKNQQLKIVTKVNDLLTLCDQLKTQLTNAQTTQLNLTDTLTEMSHPTKH